MGIIAISRAAASNLNDDLISRRAAMDFDSKVCKHIDVCDNCLFKDGEYCAWAGFIMRLPSVTPKQRTGHCKDCKYFEYDSFAKVEGIPLPFIVAHEICSKWGNGCKTREDGYCFMFEQRESEEQK